MSSSIASRRAAKAARRKKVLAERRKGPPAARPSLISQARYWARLPLERCIMQDGLFKHGNGMLVLTRKIGRDRLAMGSFLLDVFCLGVKDVTLREADIFEIEEMTESMAQEAPFRPIEPARARKLLHDLVHWSRSIGIEPHHDYVAAELLFGDAAAESCTETFQFGRDGRPFYMPGIDETQTQVRRRLEQLERRLGEDGFDFADEEEEDEEALVDGEGGYDPHQAPDPAAWAEFDEDEKVQLVEDYHDEAGIDPPNAHVHAAMHVVIENQIAEGDALPVRRTVERLIAEGLDRHDALHAVGSVLAAHIDELAQRDDKSEVTEDAYHAAVERLTAESWRRDFGGEYEPEED